MPMPKSVGVDHRPAMRQEVQPEVGVGAETICNVGEGAGTEIEAVQKLRLLQFVRVGQRGQQNTISNRNAML